MTSMVCDDLNGVCNELQGCAMTQWCVWELSGREHLLNL